MLSAHPPGPWPPPFPVPAWPGGGFGGGGDSGNQRATKVLRVFWHPAPAVAGEPSSASEQLYALFESLCVASEVVVGEVGTASAVLRATPRAAALLLSGVVEDQLRVALEPPMRPPGPSVALPPLPLAAELLARRPQGRPAPAAAAAPQVQQEQRQMQQPTRGEPPPLRVVLAARRAGAGAGGRTVLSRPPQPPPRHEQREQRRCQEQTEQRTAAERERRRQQHEAAALQAQRVLAAAAEEERQRVEAANAAARAERKQQLREKEQKQREKRAAAAARQSARKPAKAAGGAARAASHATAEAEAQAVVQAGAAVTAAEDEALPCSPLAPPPGEPAEEDTGRFRGEPGLRKASPDHTQMSGDQGDAHGNVAVQSAARAQPDAGAGALATACVHPRGMPAPSAFSPVAAPHTLEHPSSSPAASSPAPVAAQGTDAADSGGTSADMGSGISGSQVTVRGPLPTRTEPDCAVQSGLTSPEALQRAAAVVDALPGSPLHLARQRVGLPPGPIPDPRAFDADTWAQQGNVVRSIISHQFVEGELHFYVAWECSWHPAGDFAGLLETDAYQQRLRDGGDATNVVDIAREQAAAADEAERQQQQQQQQKRRPRREQEAPEPRRSDRVRGRSVAPDASTA